MRWVNAAASSRSFTASAPPGADGRSRERRVERNAADAPAICCSRPVRWVTRSAPPAAGAGPGAAGRSCRCANRRWPNSSCSARARRRRSRLAGDLLHAGPVARGGQGGAGVGAEAAERLDDALAERAVAAQAAVEHPAHLAAERHRDADQGAQALLGAHQLGQGGVAALQRQARAGDQAARGCRAPPSSRDGRSSGAGCTAGGARSPVARRENPTTSTAIRRLVSDTVAHAMRDTTSWRNSRWPAASARRSRLMSAGRAAIVRDGPGRVLSSAPSPLGLRCSEHTAATPARAARLTRFG